MGDHLCIITAVFLTYENLRLLLLLFCLHGTVSRKFCPTDVVNTLSHSMLNWEWIIAAVFFFRSLIGVKKAGDVQYFFNKLWRLNMVIPAPLARQGVLLLVPVER